jgi:ribonuclease P protein component
VPSPAASTAGRIHRRATLRALRRPEGRFSRGPLRVTYVSLTDPGAGDRPQVGYAVSRRCGTAVARNRIRRRLRAAVQIAAADGLPAGSYLLRPEADIAQLDHPALVALVGEALRGAPQRAARRSR